jgi:N-acetylmuramoyl-L-alanine amidase
MMNSALLCMTLVVFNEARGEPLKGKAAVAHVVMNRAKHHKNVCKVVFTPAQFSIKKVNKKDKAWKSSKEISEKVLYGKLKDNTNHATYFHHVSIKPHWSKKQKHTTTIGPHKFYRAK